jgi:dUTPase
MKFLKIKRILKDKQKCSDITVHNNHNFFCNNVLIHNCDYRGEVKVAITLLSGYQPNDHYEIKKGDKIAQMIFAEVPKINLSIADSAEELTNTTRGSGGFNSTGR